MNKERLEEIVEKISDQTYDRIIVPKTKITIDYQDIKFLINVIIEQSERVQDQQATIESLSMAHDAIHRVIPKDKHTLIKNIIGLNKRVQELEDVLDQDHRQDVIEGMYED